MSIDPVILRLEADLKKYQADLNRAQGLTDQNLSVIEARTRKMEAEFRRASGAIGDQFKGLAASLGSYFTGRELLGLTDSFTRLQNNLRVAGIAGEDMKAVQDRLFESAQKYGVEIEGLSGLFSSLTQASKELGASQEQVFGIADAVSASLKITGSSAAEAGGALMQLQQVFRGSKVQAEEYNSLIDGLYPLLEAAAAGSDRWGGSVGKLTADVKASKVTSAEFFQAILAGSDMLEGKAANANLTLSAGVTTLTNALTVYIGEADKANGVSGALGEALGRVASNLDSLIPALATVAAIIGTRYVTGMVAAGAATVAKTVAEVRGIQVAAAYAAAQAQTAGILGIEAAAASRAAVSVTGLAVAQGVAARAGGLLLAAIGGPIGAAVLALGAVLYIATTRTSEFDGATEAYTKTQNEANAATKKASDLAEKLATAHGKAREEALALARAEQENIRKKLESARASVILAKAELARAKAFQAGQNRGATYASGGSAGLAGSMFIRGTGDVRAAQANANVKVSEDAVANLEKSLATIGDAINAGASSPVAAVGPSKKGKGKTGASAADIASRFNDQLASLMAQTNSTYGSIALSAQERAEYELRNVELARIRAVDDVKAQKDYSTKQKEVLTSQIEFLAAAERSRIEFDERARIEQESRDLAQERYNSDRDALQVQYDLSDSQSERKRIALSMLDLEIRHQKSLLEAVIASETATQAEKKRAKIALDGINSTSAARTMAADRANATPLEAYARSLSADRVDDQIEGLVIDELQSVRDSIRSAVEKATGIKDPLISGLINMLIEQVLIRPIAEALSKSGGGGGGFFSSVIGSLFGRASGGSVMGGQMYRVNEGASPGRVEGFIPRGSGTIVPLGQMGALTRSGGGNRVFNVNVDARNSVTPTGFAQQLSAAILQQAAQMDAQTSARTLRAVPGRFDQFQRDGN
jgi:tape measure domain-containing protein